MCKSSCLGVHNVLIVEGRLLHLNEAVTRLADFESVLVTLVICLVYARIDGSLRVQEVGRRGGSYDVM